MAVLRLPAGAPGERQMQTVAVGGRRLHYLTAGAGEPVVLVHGLGGSWQWWLNNIDALATRQRVLALDLGRRERWLDGRGRVRPAHAAEALVQWLDAVGLERAHIVGHSLGGQMAIRLAAAYPERVNRLVLVDSAGLPFEDGLLRLTLRAIGPAPERTRAFRRLVLASAVRTNPLVVLQTAREMLRDDISHLLEHVQAPTLIVWGERDPMVPVANAYRLQAAIPGARLLVVPGSGHNPMFYHPALFNRTVLDFFGESPGSAG